MNHFAIKSIQKAKVGKSGEECKVLSESYREYDGPYTMTKGGKKLVAILNLVGKKVKLQVDTAAAKNVIIKEDYEKIGVRA